MMRHSPYRADIDGLRAISVLAVLVYHTFPSLLPGGFIGVDVFFVISGYLISLIIIRETDAGTFSLTRFYRRRLQRIVPALIPVLIACLLLGWFVLLPAEYEALGKHVASATTFTSNLVFWSESGYFDVNRAYKPLLHLWSLSVEEQFYLIWPIVAMLAYKVGIRPLLLLLGGGSFILGVAYEDANPASVFFLPHYRVWELIFGASLAWFRLPQLAEQSKILGTKLLSTSVTGLLLLLACMFWIDQSYGEPGWPGWWAILPTTGAALIIISGTENFLNQRILGSRLMVTIGRISFSLYLWHWPLLSFARIMETGEPPVAVRLIIICLSFFLAWATYALLEKPLRYKKGPLTPIGLGAALIVLLTAGLLIMYNHGVPSRNPEFQHQVDDAMWMQRLDSTCPNGIHQFDFHCTSNGRKAEIAVLGDSHSINMFYALTHRYRKTGIGVIGLGKAGCPTLYGYETDAIGEYNCGGAVKASVDYVIRSKSIHTVYLSTWSQYVSLPVSETNSSVDRQEQARSFRLGLESTIRLLLDAKKQIVLVIDWPTINFNPNACLNRRAPKLLAEVKQNCTIPRDAYLEHASKYHEILYSLLNQYTSLKYLDAAEVFCEEDICWVKKAGSVFYGTRDHLSIPGSRYLGENLTLKSLFENIDQ